MARFKLDRLGKVATRKGGQGEVVYINEELDIAFAVFVYVSPVSGNPNAVTMRYDLEGKTYYYEHHIYKYLDDEEKIKKGNT